MTDPTPTAAQSPSPITPGTPATASTGKSISVNLAAALSSTPSQVRHPWRATLRTVLAGVIGAASVIPEVVTITHPSSGTLLAIAGQLVVVSGAVTKIVALPTVNAWLTTLGLGAEPKA